VIGTTWRYVNKKGGPDLRFNDNRQIPIYRYGQVDLSCGSWRLHLCLSRADAAGQFAIAMRAALAGDQSKPQEQSSEAPPRKSSSVPRDLAAAFRVFGLPSSGASSEDASAAYKDLAAQNHPDKVAQMAPEFRELAERKMRELNAAYELIRNSYHQCP
jgi:DnaJ-domain-containing protein 1